MEGKLVMYLKCTSCSSLFRTEDLFYQHCRNEHCKEVIVFEHESDSSVNSVDENEGDHTNVECDNPETNDVMGSEYPKNDVESNSHLEHTASPDDESSSHSAAALDKSSSQEDTVGFVDNIKLEPLSLSDADGPVEAILQFPSKIEIVDNIEGLEDFEMMSDVSCYSMPNHEDSTDEIKKHFLSLSFQEYSEIGHQEPNHQTKTMQNISTVGSHISNQHVLQVSESSNISSETKPGRAIYGTSLRNNYGFCTFCNKNFKWLRSHMHYEHRNKKLHICEICGKVCKLKGHLQTHMYSHTGEKPYKCDICGKGFLQTALRNQHRLNHFEERNYLCSQCGNGFKTKDHLRAHSLLHTSERPYKCDVGSCTKAFKTTSCLNAHKLTHNNIKPYTCEECNKSFTTKSNLAMHVRSHTGEKPYKCSFCEKVFQRSQDMHKHCRSEHKVNTARQRLVC